MPATTLLTRHLLPGEAGTLAEARRIVDGAAAELGFPADERFELTLAANEAMINAVEHGCCEPGDTVALSAAADGGRITFEISDSGRFQPRAPAGEELPERMRGLTLMAHLMDEVCIVAGDDGTTIRLSKRRD